MVCYAFCEFQKGAPFSSTAADEFFEPIHIRETPVQISAASICDFGFQTHFIHNKHEGRVHEARLFKHDVLFTPWVKVYYRIILSMETFRICMSVSICQHKPLFRDGRIKIKT